MKVRLKLSVIINYIKNRAYFVIICVLLLPNCTTSKNEKYAKVSRLEGSNHHLDDNQDSVEEERIGKKNKMAEMKEKKRNKNKNKSISKLDKKNKKSQKIVKKKLDQIDIIVKEKDKKNVIDHKDLTKSGSVTFREGAQLVIPLHQTIKFNNEPTNSLGWRGLCKKHSKIILCSKDMRPMTCKLSDIRTRGNNLCMARHKLIKKVCRKRNKLKYQIKKINCVPTIIPRFRIKTFE